MIQNDAITGVNGRSQTSVLQGNMSITIAQGALLAKAAKTMTLQVGNTKLLIAPSGISLDATSIHINPASSGSAMPSQIIHQTLTRDDAQTKIDNAMQTDVGASKAASSKSNHEWEIKALAASMIIAIPFDTIFAGEVEQAAAGAEITSLEIEDLAADVASDEASSLETEDLGEETAEDLSGEPSEDLGADEQADSNSLQDLFTNGRIAKASELKKFAENRGWSPRQSDNGPLKYFDKNGKERIAIKKGSARTPGSEEPHVALRDENGRFIDPFGNKVKRMDPGNHTRIDYDI
jgi:hypothetical protein